MAQAIADILKPTIKDAVEQAIQSSLTKLQADMQAQDKRIGETEQRINTLEEEIMEVQSTTTKSDMTIKMLLEKGEDL